MGPGLNRVIIWLVVLMNAAAFLTVRADKIRAENNRRRIRENTLFILAVLGGSPGLFASMLIFRHKTKHKKFMLGVPAIFLAEFLVYIIFKLS